MNKTIERLLKAGAIVIMFGIIITVFGGPGIAIVPVGFTLVVGAFVLQNFASRRKGRTGYRVRHVT